MTHRTPLVHGFTLAMARHNTGSTQETLWIRHIPSGIVMCRNIAATAQGLVSMFLSIVGPSGETTQIGHVVTGQQNPLSRGREGWIWLQASADHDPQELLLEHANVLVARHLTHATVRSATRRAA